MKIIKYNLLLKVKKISICDLAMDLFCAIAIMAAINNV